MTVATATNIERFTGDNTTGPFSPSYLLLDADHLEVYVNDVLQTKGTHYSVSNIGDPPTAGFDVTFEAGQEPASGTTVTIQRVVPYTQETDYLENDPFPAAAHETALDKLTMLCQQLKRAVGRTMGTPVEDDPDRDMTLPDKATRAGEYLGFDSDGKPVAKQVADLSTSLDTTINSPSAGHLLKHDGTNWVNITPGALCDLTIAPGTIREYSGASLPDADKYGHWLWPDGSTIGDVGSGADHEDAALKDLFDVVKGGHGNVGTENFANGDTVKWPDRRGRVGAGKDDMGGTAAGRLTSASKAGIDGTTLGASGGAEGITLVLNELPSFDIDDYFNFSQNSHDHTYTKPADGGLSGTGGNIKGSQTGGTTTRALADITISFDPIGGDEAHANVQPTYVNNFIIKR